MKVQLTEGNTPFMRRDIGKLGFTRGYLSQVQYLGTLDEKFILTGAEARRQLKINFIAWV